MVPKSVRFNHILPFYRLILFTIRIHSNLPKVAYILEKSRLYFRNDSPVIPVFFFSIGIPCHARIKVLCIHLPGFSTELDQIAHRECRWPV